MGTKLLCPWCQRFNYITGVGPHFCRGCSHRTDVEKGSCDCLMCDPMLADLGALPDVPTVNAPLPDVPLEPLPDVPPQQREPGTTYTLIMPDQVNGWLEGNARRDESSEDDRVLETVVLADSETRVRYGIELCGHFAELPRLVVEVRMNSVVLRFCDGPDNEPVLIAEVSGERLAKWSRSQGMAEERDDASADFE